tara:strand:- start:484 stop:894 length:411 start_codon:yes stop_codon:yes gene_type:complete
VWHCVSICCFCKKEKEKIYQEIKRIVIMAMEGVKFVTSALEGDLQTLRYMLQNGTRVNCFNPTNGRNALHEAAAFGKEPVVRFLIENGVNIHSRTMLGRESALHLASSNGQEVTTKILLKRGCRVNDVNKQGGKSS